MELNFVSFEQAVTYTIETPHHVVLGDLSDVQAHISKYTEYFCEFHYFHLIKVEGEVIGLVVESLM